MLVTPLSLEPTTPIVQSFEENQKHNHSFIPSHILERITGASSELISQHREATERFRAASHKWIKHEDREEPTEELLSKTPAFGVYEKKHFQQLPGTQLTKKQIASDEAASNAYNGAKSVYQFYKEVFNRNSIDDKGMNIVSTVHYGKNYNNAFWNNQQMVYGDGDGVIFTNFTDDPDVIAHELSHGVTQYTANLVYEKQSGALNESFSDAMGSTFKQWQLKQTVDQADWLIGDVVLLGSGALRSMKAPGTAYNEQNAPALGNDSQPATMDAYLQMGGDTLDVHYGSGVPNHAFYLAATKIGGYAWEKTAKIWYNTMNIKDISPTIDFAGFATLTQKTAAELFGSGSREETAVVEAWRETKVLK